MATKEKILSLEEIKNSTHPIQNVNEVHKKGLTKVEKLALVITQRVGTMGFFFLILVWTVGWLGWNMLAPMGWRFDPYPAFVLWLFISNLIQIHLMPLIMVGQNIQGKHSELRADHDYETDKKAEKEVEAILQHLENQQDIMLDILKRLEKLEEKK